MAHGAGGPGRDMVLEWTAERQRVYEQLLSRGTDRSAIADLLVRYGPSVLDREVPYLLVALRHAATDAQRREQRQVRLAGRLAAAPDLSRFGADPLDIVMARDSLQSAIRALSALDPADAWALWWHAAGCTDDEIGVLWADAGFQPAHPSAAFLRKRRERSRKLLRDLGSDTGDSPAQQSDLTADIARWGDDMARAGALGDAVYKVGARRARYKQRTKPVPGSLEVVVMVAPTGQNDLASEVALVKSALLYADRVTLVSPTASMLAAAQYLADVPGAEETDVLLELLPSIAEPNVAEMIRRIRALRRQKHKARDLLILLGQLEQQVKQLFPQVRSVVGRLLEQSGGSELDEAIGQGLLVVDPLHLDSPTVDQMINAFMNRIQRYLNTPEIYPMFDDRAGGLVRAGLNAGMFTVPRLVQARADEVGLGGGLIARLPTFPTAEMGAILDARQALTQKVPAFRRAIRQMRSRLTTTAFDEEFPAELAQIYSHEVVPALAEIRNVLHGPGFAKTLLKVSMTSAAPPALGLIVLQSRQLPFAVKATLAAVSFGATATYTLGRDREEREQKVKSHDLYFLYGLTKRLQ